MQTSVRQWGYRAGRVAEQCLAYETPLSALHTSDPGVRRAEFWHRSSPLNWQRLKRAQIEQPPRCAALRRAISHQVKIRGARHQRLQESARLQACDWGAGTEVDAAPER